MGLWFAEGRLVAERVIYGWFSAARRREVSVDYWKRPAEEEVECVLV